METKRWTIDPKQIDTRKIEEAGKLLREGKLVAFPTETVYGLGADGLNEEAAAKIYAAKGRPSDNPLIVHIARFSDLPKLAERIPEQAKALADAFWPGPLTMIFQKTSRVPLGTTGGLSTVAVRMPNHPVALAMIEAGGGFIAAPSANTSGRPSPTTAAHVAEDLTGKIPLILDGGPVGIGLESTIVDVSTDTPMLLRPGYISREMLEQVIGPVMVDPALEGAGEVCRPKAPGMKYRHYAPHASMTIVEGETGAVVRTINRLAKEADGAGQTVGILASAETAGLYQTGIVRCAGHRECEEEIAAGLYAVLREFDQLAVDVIYSEAFSGKQLGFAIQNRMHKAAGHQVIQAESVEGGITDVR